MNDLEYKAVRRNKLALLIFIFSSVVVASAELYTFYQITKYLTDSKAFPSLFNFVFACAVFIIFYIYNRKQLYQIPKNVAIWLGDILMVHFINGNISTRAVDKGIIQSLLVDELRRFVHLLVTPSIIIIQRVCVLCVYCLAAIFILGPLTLLLIIFVPLVFGYIFYIMKTKRALGLKIQKGQFLRSSISNLLSNDLLHVRSLSQRSIVHEEFNIANEQYYSAYRDSSFIVDTQRLIFDIIIFTTFGAILLFPQGNQVHSGFIFILIILLRIAPHVLAIVGNVTVLFVNRDSSIALNNVLSQKGSETKVITKMPLSRNSIIEVQFKGQSFIFKSGVNIVTGPSGCGKSTLLEDLIGIDKCVIDVLKADDKNIKVIDAVFTGNNPLTISGSIDKNLTSHEVDQNLFNQLLDKLNMPTGKELKELLSNDSILSLGQRQRFAFARALSSGKKVIIFDETLGGLDQVSFDKCVKILKKQLDKIIIIATHDDRLIKEFGFVIDGKNWSK